MVLYSGVIFSVHILKIVIVFSIYIWDIKDKKFNIHRGVDSMENKIGKGETILGKYNLYITSQNGIKLQSLYSFGKRVVGVGVVNPLPKIEFALGDNIDTLI